MFKKKKFQTLGTKLISRDEVNNSSFDTSWRNAMNGITARLEAEQFVLVGEGLVNITKILSEEGESALSVLSGYRGDLHQIEEGSQNLINSADASTQKELEQYIPLSAMSDLVSSMKRLGVDRQIINALVASKVLHKVTSEIEELKKIMIEGYEGGHISDTLAKELQVFGFGVNTVETPKTTLISKKGNKVTLNENGESPFGRKGFGASQEMNKSNMFGGNVFGQMNKFGKSNFNNSNPFGVGNRVKPYGLKSNNPFGGNNNIGGYSYGNNTFGKRIDTTQSIGSVFGNRVRSGFQNRTFEPEQSRSVFGGSSIFKNNKRVFGR